MEAREVRGDWHVAFARVPARRRLPSVAERPVLEALVLLACASEAALQASALDAGITKRWFAESATGAVGLFRLPQEAALSAGITEAATEAAVVGLITRGIVVRRDNALLLPERLRRTGVLAWNACVVGNDLLTLPRVMYPRTRASARRR